MAQDGHGGSTEDGFLWEERPPKRRWHPQGLEEVRGHECVLDPLRLVGPRYKELRVEDINRRYILKGGNSLFVVPEIIVRQ
jgi:hypothetical protein